VRKGRSFDYRFFILFIAIITSSDGSAVLRKDSLETPVLKDDLAGAVREVPPELLQAGVVVDWRESLELYLQDFLGLAEIGLDLIAELLDDVSIGQPHHAVSFRIGHQSLPPRGPYLRPPFVLPHPLLPHHLLPYTLLVLLDLFGICWFVLLAELGVEGLHGCLVETIPVVL
jgi:hypothetical protein